MQRIHERNSGVATGAVVVGCRWWRGRVLGWPDLLLLAAEVAIGVLAYTLFAWPDIRWFLREGFRTVERER